VAKAEHQYPVTKLAWGPGFGNGPELFATTGDYFRLWEVVSPDAISSDSSAADQLLICRAQLQNVRRVGQVCSIDA
jgi:hypothetical protein